MFVCETADGRSYLVKQSNGKSNGGEAFAYEAIAGMPGLIEGVRSIAAHDISVVPFLPDAATLRDAVLNGLQDFFAPIHSMAASLGVLDVRRELVDRVPRRAVPFCFPVPECSQVLDCNVPLEELFRTIQEGGIVSQEAVDLVDDLPLAPTHGDIKLDNVLLQGGDVFLIDWELFSSGPAGWSIASCVGMVFFAATIASKEETPSFSQMFAAAQKIFREYAELLDRHGLSSPSIPSFATMVQLYMLEQVASGLMFKRQLDPLDRAVIEVVKHIGQSQLHMG